MNKLKKVLMHPELVVAWAFRKTGKCWSDVAYLKILYFLYYGKKLNLKTPKSYTQKMQWLKLYNRLPIYTKMVDKYAVKEFVKEKIGEDTIIPCYGIWDKFDDIDFDKLPSQFVLKCTHDSGSIVVCKDKSKFDKDACKKKIERCMKKEYYYVFREWPYKNVKPRIMAEKYEPSLGNKDSIEYKLTCCDGEVKCITVCSGIPHTDDYSSRHNDNFDVNWNRQNWYAYYKPKGGNILKPKMMDKIVSLSNKLSEGIPYVRIDWYIVNGKPYFGEFTFFTWGGFVAFTPREWDLIIGEWIKLPSVITQ